LLLESRVVKSVLPAELSSRQVGSEFRRALADGLRIRCAGSAKGDPESLLRLGYTPKHKLELFDVRFYLTGMRIDENFRFFVAYVVLPDDRGRPGRTAYPRIFYKDDENWIGKGALKWVREGEDLVLASAEETTNLPLELQHGLDIASRSGGKARGDTRATDLVLRRAPDHRAEPYADFSTPRARAYADPRNRIHGGRPIATFTRPGDPSSLRFVTGFEPDFRNGQIDETRAKSRIYDGVIRKFRFLSRNRKIQYQFIAGPHHVWIVPPQTTHTGLTSYGVRPIDVEADEDLCLPGYEYHFMDPNEDPPRLFSQIPPGFAGKASSVDPDRADASPWIEKMPVIQRFRAEVLRRR
jgi:hypothetical protein